MDMKGYVGGLLRIYGRLFQDTVSESAFITEVTNPSSNAFLRKEVIQPQVPLRLPCYDFTPVAKPTVVACFPCGLAQRLRVDPTPMV